MEPIVAIIIGAVVLDLAVTFFVMRAVLRRRRAKQEPPSESLSRDIGLGPDA